MKLTYKQIKEALYAIYIKEFCKNGKQPIVKYDCLNDVSMRDMIYLLDGVGNRDFVEIDESK